MPAVSENEGQNFEDKARRGREIMDTLRKMSSKQNKTAEEKQKLHELIQELNEINEWFQKTAK